MAPNVTPEAKSSMSNALLSGLVRGDMYFPDCPNIDAEITFEIWQEEEYPYRAANCKVSRLGGGLQIDFPGGLGDDKSTWAVFSIDSDGALRFELFRNDVKVESVDIHSAR